MKYALGKLPARPDSVKLRFSQFFNVVPGLLRPPLRIGHELIGHDWGMLANDKIGDCTIAGAAHEHMVWTHMGSRSAGTDFKDEDVIADYSAVSGYDGSRKSDVGADMAEVARYRRKVGVLDAHGVRHKIDAYLALVPGDYEQLAWALYLTGAVGVGIRAPNNVAELFDAHKPWDITPGTRTAGGHYIPAILRNSRGVWGVITWGGVQGMTNAFYERYCDEALAYISLEIVDAKGLSPDGFDREGLIKHLTELTS